jgi:hypothetical protein
MRRANGRGRIFRGAFASRGASSDAGGSSAPAFGLASLLLLALMLLLAPGAGAATVTQRPVLFTIDGAEVSPGRPMKGGQVAVDNATGALYVSEEEGYSQTARIYRFHADGTPWPFPSSGLAYLSVSGQPAVAVDNSGGANQSRIYVGSSNKLNAFDPNGEELWSLGLPATAQDVAVDPAGFPHVAFFSSVRKYSNVGSPPAELSSFSAFAQKLDVNAAGDVFLAASSSIQKWVGGSLSSTLDSKGSDVYLDQSSPTGHTFTTYKGDDERQKLTVSATAGQFRLTFGGAQTPDLPYNASEAQITAALEALPTIGVGNARASFTPSPPNSKQLEFRGGFLERTDVEQVTCQNGTTPLSGGAGCSTSTLADGVPSDVQEYAADGTLLGTFGLGELNNGHSLAYNPSLDRVYVAQDENTSETPFFAALGPVTTGTVGDATIEAPSAVGVATAHFSGTVNPQGTSSEWRFQWRRLRQGWAAAASSPAQSLPVDSSDHTVEYTTNALRGNTRYQVRLVAVNTANQLLGASEPKLVTTSTAAQAPAVTIAAPGAIAAHTAKISGTVNPQGDTAEWRVQLSTDAACATGFKDQPFQQISTSSNSPVNVEFELTGLLPAQHYCARIQATNSAGSTTSTIQQFETLDSLPTQVLPAFAAPRTDTTARVNGYVNPEGSDATYRFEYSADGTSWTTLPDGQTRKAREQIVIGSDITGLSPDSTYHFRFTVENGAGPVQSGETTFQTRTTAEMQMPARGIELVNPPNKGNQNLATENIDGNGLTPDDMVRADGQKIIWETFAGTPDGNTGAAVAFLSSRTASGWSTQALAPPASQQIGGGEFLYKLNAISPDFSTFLMRAALNGIETAIQPTYVRIDDQYNQEPLKEFTAEVRNESYQHADMTSDGAHVLVVNPETEQLEDIGSEPNEVISVMPGGLPAECGVRPDAFYGHKDATQATGGQWEPYYHRMAVTDASRVYFQAFANGGSCTDSGEHHEALFYRDRTAGQTVEIDAGDSVVDKPALIRATPDGRSVFFVTPTAHAADDHNVANDVYRWDAESGDYTCLTCVVAEAGVLIGSSAGKVRISEDFSHLYFVSNKALVPGHAGAGAKTYALRLSDGRLNQVTSGSATVLNEFKLSRDGNVLLFMSASIGGSTRLTADEQADECVKAVSHAKETGCRELFRYEDSTNSLECLSCLPGGVTAYGVGEMLLSAALSSDGSVVAFVTHERLVPEDINNSEDVYEWKNGALRLISDGETVFPSETITGAPRILGMGANGDDIFFSIIDRGLTGYEQDGLGNLYDARVGGGFPRPVEPAHCSEESCQGSLITPPPTPRTGSAGLNGAGNQPAAAKKGRCAAKRGKAKRRCTNRKHAHKKHKQKRRSAKRANAQSDRGSK